MDDLAVKPELVRTRSILSTKDAASVGRNRISLKPHESYEGCHRWDPDALWTAEEEAKVVRKADFYLLSWICFMFFGLQLDRGNIANALTDNMLDDLGMTTDDYNNVSNKRISGEAFQANKSRVRLCKLSASSLPSSRFSS